MGAKARRVLHVGVTRAVPQLWVTYVGDPSHVIEEAERACAVGGEGAP